MCSKNFQRDVEMKFSKLDLVHNSSVFPYLDLHISRFHIICLFCLLYELVYDVSVFTIIFVENFLGSRELSGSCKFDIRICGSLVCHSVSNKSSININLEGVNNKFTQNSKKILVFHFVFTKHDQIFIQFYGGTALYACCLSACCCGVSAV